MDDIKKDLDKITNEFIAEYKEPKSNDHLLKLFDKKGTEIIEIAEETDEKLLRDLKLRISCFFQEALKLNTVSFLFGTGPSNPLGAESIYEIPSSICSKIQDEKLGGICEELIKSYGNKPCDKKGGCKINLEKFLGDLIRLETTAKSFAQILNLKKDLPKQINRLIKVIKKELFNISNVPNKAKIKDEPYKSDPIKVHKEFIKKILARPVNLKRINIFTTNYDLAFEKTMDDLGVIYIDGFIGNIKRIFKPEVYNYDYYFPASTTEGNVHRLDKVIHFYKLHGSLNWTESPIDEKNIYGIEQKREVLEYDDSVLIYPQPMKEEETLGFPYSEMFRRFANIVQQPQNVLITYGYGFGDEHINRVIFNALSISSFQLIVVSYGWTPKLKEFYENVCNDSRVSFLIGKYLGDWLNFVFNLLPDIKQFEFEQNILATMKKLKQNTKEEEVSDHGKR